MSDKRKIHVRVYSFQVIATLFILSITVQIQTSVRFGSVGKDKVFMYEIMVQFREKEEKGGNPQKIENKKNR